MLSCHLKSVLWALALLFTLPILAVSQNQQRERPPVTWVNPKLPAGPRLTHHLLDSKAMGRKVGYVVWTPKDFNASGVTRYPVVYFLHGMGGNEVIILPNTKHNLGHYYERSGDAMVDLLNNSLFDTSKAPSGKNGHP